MARLHTRCFYYICSWPLRAVLFLSQKRDQREMAATAFSNLDECCTPRGVKALRKQVRDGVPAHCFAPKVLKCMEEFAAQPDLTNFDKEVDHAQIGAMLRAANGRTPPFQSTAEAYLAASAGFDHARFQPPQPSAARGRPRKPSKKRKRCDAWNAFTVSHPPTCEKCHAGAGIKSGNYLRDLAATWATMDDAARQPFQTIADAKKMRGATLKRARRMTASKAVKTSISSAQALNLVPCGESATATAHCRQKTWLGHCTRMAAGVGKRRGARTGCSFKYASHL